MADDRLQRLEQLCAGHGVTVLYAYGSRALQALRWLHRGGVLAAGASDLDLAVSGGIGRRFSLAKKVAIASALSDLFEFEATDLADRAEVDPFVAANIVRGERLYCADRLYADELDLYVLHANEEHRRAVAWMRDHLGRLVSALYPRLQRMLLAGN